eukprot:m.9148 g.9148  ORF g.9148 m.9148 type:complete len:287 (+) comp21128_c0_seq2:91-951(+)
MLLRAFSLHARSCLRRSFSSSVRTVVAVHGMAYNPTKLPDKTKLYGQDAYFVSQTTTCTAVGVADGVGSWVESGVDPSVFPSVLMQKCSEAVTSGSVVPSVILDKAFTSMQKASKPVAGSSTACLAVILGSELSTANLGDSGFVVVRNHTLVLSSEAQMHTFNYPYQLSILPEGKSTENSLSSAAADTRAFQLEIGDVVIVATDGLFNNLYNDQILSHASLVEVSDEKSLRRLVAALVNEAKTLSFDMKNFSPFAEESTRVYSHRLMGGRPDDITVIALGITAERK